MATSLLTALRSGRVLLMDGAMGTELARRRVAPNATATGDAQRLDAVRRIHAAYQKAGAEVHLSSTFLQFADRPASPPIDDALAAMPTDSYRLLALGPVAGPIGPREFESIRQFILPKDLPIDGVLLETCSSPRVWYALNRVPYPALLSLTYHRDDQGRLRTWRGQTPEWFAQRARDHGVVALGVNCGHTITVSDCAEILRRYREQTDLPLFARPNAGTPQLQRGKYRWPLTPRQMARELPLLLEAGAAMVGGCCGTTPRHIAQFRSIIDAWNRHKEG